MKVVPILIESELEMIPEIQPALKTGWKKKPH
jgi:hypothetical protein